MESFFNTLLVAYLKVIKKYADFNGRADRREFWMFVLCNFIVVIVLSILGVIPVLGILFKIISGLYGLAVLIPGLAVSARRLHDTDRTALFLLLALIPVVGTIVLLVFCVAEGTAGDNKYGPDPKTLA